MSETETIEKEEIIEDEEQQQAEKEEYENSQRHDEDLERKIREHNIIEHVTRLSIDEAFLFVNMQIDEHDLWEQHLKKHVIRIIAEKIKATNTIADKDIAATVVEGLRGRISKKYVYQCLDTSFKSQTRSEASKVGAETRKIQNEFKTDEQLNAEHIALSENNSIHQLNVNKEMEREFVEQTSKIAPSYQDEYQVIDQSGGATIQMKLEDYENLCRKLEMAEKQIKAMKGELPYDECQEPVRIIKWDKYKVGEVDRAYKAAISEVVFKVDLRTNKLLTAITDKEQQQSKKRRSNKK